MTISVYKKFYTFACEQDSNIHSIFLSNASTSDSKPFNKYLTNDNAFLYRWKKIKKQSSVTLEIVIEQVKRDIKTIMSLPSLDTIINDRKFYTYIKKVKILNFLAEVSILSL
jgi:hypothetical protein